MSTPSPAAIRAAKRILSPRDVATELEYVARIIDQETPHAELVASLRDVLFAAQNADETGYVTDVGFLDLDAIHDKAHALLAKLEPTP
jgi:hypothetical protein